MPGVVGFAAIVERASIRRLAMPPRVTLRPPLLQQIQAVGARPAGQLNGAGMEQPQQHIHHLEDLRSIVLVDEIQLGRGVQLAGDIAVVEVGSQIWIGDVLEADRPLRTDADHVEEAIAAGRRGGNLFRQFGEAFLEMLCVGLAFLGRNIGELVADEPVPESLDCFRLLDGHRTAPESVARTRCRLYDLRPVRATRRLVSGVCSGGSGGQRVPLLHDHYLGRIVGRRRAACDLR